MALVEHGDYVSLGNSNRGSVPETVQTYLIGIKICDLAHCHYLVGLHPFPCLLIYCIVTPRPDDSIT